MFLLFFHSFVLDCSRRFLENPKMSWKFHENHWKFQETSRNIQATSRNIQEISWNVHEIAWKFHEETSWKFPGMSWNSQEKIGISLNVHEIS